MSKRYILPRWQENALYIVHKMGILEEAQLNYIIQMDERFKIPKENVKIAKHRFLLSHGMVASGGYIYLADNPDVDMKDRKIVNKNDEIKPNQAAQEIIEAIWFILFWATQVKRVRGEKDLDLSNFERYRHSFFDANLTVSPQIRMPELKLVKTGEKEFTTEVGTTPLMSDDEKARAFFSYDIRSIGKYRGEFERFAGEFFAMYNKLAEDNTQKQLSGVDIMKERVDVAEKAGDFLTYAPTIIVPDVTSAAYFFRDFYQRTGLTQLTLTFWTPSGMAEFKKIPLNDVKESLKRIMEVEQEEKGSK